LISEHLANSRRGGLNLTELDWLTPIKRSSTMATYDLLIRNALIADGSGADTYFGDLGVVDGRIAAVSESLDGDATTTIDAEGSVLAPGVIDVHTHYDAQLTWEPTASPSPELGVTTIVIGNCGFGIAPATPESRTTIAQNLSVVEAMAYETLEAGIDWSFNSFAEYLELLETKGAYPNVAAYASHSAIRTVVMGDAGSEREATADELARMVGLFRECMEAGAFGLGSSTFDNHYGWGGIPVPSRLASDDEFRAFARVIGDFGVGSMMATCGNRTTISFLEELANISQRPVVYAPLLHYSNQPERAANIVAECAAARGRGNPVFAQASCQPLSMDFQLTAAYPLLTIAGWPNNEHDVERLSTVYADPSFRDQVRADLEVPNGARIFNGRWDRVEVTIAAHSANQHLEGQTIADIATELAADPLDVFLDLGLREQLETTFTAKLLNVEEDAVAELLDDDGIMVSLSDAGAHHTFFCDAGFGMHFLGHWVRERGQYDLPTAVRKLTSDLANIYGIQERGELKIGNWADLILFDPQRIGITKTERIHDLPADGERLVRHAPGLLGTWVNGVQVFDGQNYTKVPPPGHILRQFDGAIPRVGMPA
jgi:N-acyl-D-amino-acid deacylase